MLGPYAVKLPFNSFCLTKFGRASGSASPDLVKLRGARFAYASEGDQSAKLDAGQVKALTGGEPFTARELFKAQITFEQTWKLWLVSNYDPRVDSEDTGMWRRIVKIPFATVPPEARDPSLKHILTKEPAARSALLVWALKGCLEWQHGGLGRGGLGIPGEVASVTEAYRVRQDALADWWADLLKDFTLAPGAFCAGALLRMNYSEWAVSEGFNQVSAPRLNNDLESRGLTKSRRGGLRGWEGIYSNEAKRAQGQK
jgi:putative DNA primase/helicase